jgi:electron transfer flavoprotein beta subunit
MKILVTVKKVPDYATKIKLRADGSGVETEGIKWIVNPFDEIAVEEALKLKEAGKATEVIAVTIGPADANKPLRYALAMGADRGIHVLTDATVDSALAAKLLAAVQAKEGADLILMGKQAIDSDASQTPQLLAQHLQWAHACFASKIVPEAAGFLVTREIDGGLETLRVPRPCVISTDLRLNTPRYASLPGIMKANKKPVQEYTPEALGVPVQVQVEVRAMRGPGKRQAGRKVESVEALIKALQEEAKVL